MNPLRPFLAIVPPPPTLLRGSRFKIVEKWLNNIVGNYLTTTARVSAIRASAIGVGKMKRRLSEFQPRIADMMYGALGKGSASTSPITTEEPHDYIED